MLDEGPSDAFEHNQSWSYQNESGYDVFGEWLDLAPLVSSQSPPMTADSSDDIENIYTKLHRSLDQVVAQISVSTPARLDRIREQNRKLIEKLTTLDNVITRESAVPMSTAESHSPSPTLASDQGVVRRKGPRVLRAKGPQVVDVPVLNTSSVSDTPYQITIV